VNRRSANGSTPLSMARAAGHHAIAAAIKARGGTVAGVA